MQVVAAGIGGVFIVNVKDPSFVLDRIASAMYAVTFVLELIYLMEVNFSGMVCRPASVPMDTTMNVTARYTYAEYLNVACATEIRLKRIFFYGAKIAIMCFGLLINVGCQAAMATINRNSCILNGQRLPEYLQNAPVQLDVRAYCDEDVQNAAATTTEDIEEGFVQVPRQDAEMIPMIAPEEHDVRSQSRSRRHADEEPVEPVLANDVDGKQKPRRGRQRRRPTEQLRQYFRTVQAPHSEKRLARKSVEAYVRYKAITVIAYGVTCIAAYIVILLNEEWRNAILPLEYLCSGTMNTFNDARATSSYCHLTSEWQAFGLATVAFVFNVLFIVFYLLSIASTLRYLKNPRNFMLAAAFNHTLTPGLVPPNEMLGEERRLQSLLGNVTQ